MERNQYVVDGHASAGSSHLSLDLEGVMDATDGALDHQLFDFLHGVQQQNQQQAFQQQEAGCFSIPAPYHSQHLGSTPFHFTGLTSAEQRLPVSGLHQIFNHTAAAPPFRSQQSTPSPTPASSTVLERLVPASMGSRDPPPRNLWSTMDHTDHSSRPFDDDALVSATQRRFGYGAADGQATGVPRREFSSSAGTPLTRPMMSLQPLVSLETDDVLQLSVGGYPNVTVKAKRVPDQAGHILRERLRRDDMTSKFLMLESLLPPGPKRDRATIVEHSIEHVKNLHHRKKDLLQKRSEMKKLTTKVRRSAAMATLEPRVAHLIRPPDPPEFEKTLVVGAALPGNKNNMSYRKKAKLSSGGGGTGGGTGGGAGGCQATVAVHVNMPAEVVVEITCRPHAHIQSQVFGALERLHLDVSQCSVSTSRGLLLCSLVLQPREFLDPQIPSADIVGALKRAIRQADS